MFLEWRLRGATVAQSVSLVAQGHHTMRSRGLSPAVRVAPSCRHHVTGTRTTQAPICNIAVLALPEPRVTFSHLASDSYRLPGRPAAPTARLMMPLLVAGISVAGIARDEYS
jgi:hypothetical protein